MNEVQRVAADARYVNKRPRERVAKHVLDIKEPVLGQEEADGADVVEERNELQQRPSDMQSQQMKCGEKKQSEPLSRWR